MTPIVEDPQEAGVPDLAANVLPAASRRAAQAGHPLVLVKDGLLIRIEPSGTTVLKKLPARRRVAVRIRKRNDE